MQNIKETTNSVSDVTDEETTLPKLKLQIKNIESKKLSMTTKQSPDSNRITNSDLLRNSK